MQTPESPKTDIFAVARAAGVSPSTVSRCSNHPKLVKPATRARVRDAIQSLGYIRNRAAQAIHGKRSGTIGMIFPTVNNSIFAEVIQSFSEAVSQSGFTILIATHGFDLAREYEVLRKLLEHRVDGIALIGVSHLEETHLLIERQGVPTVSIWNYSPRSRIPSIGADNREAGRAVARHLIDLGHRDIALVFPPLQGNDRAGDRLKGARAALKAAGVKVPEAWISEAPYEISLAKDACAGLLGGRRPSALICGNDIIAQGAVFAAHASGLSVPGDISIVGIGDFIGSSAMEPGLTTARIPARRIGALAGERLASLISGKISPESARTKFDVELMARASAAPKARRAKPKAAGKPPGDKKGKASGKR